METAELARQVCSLLQNAKIDHTQHKLHGWSEIQWFHDDHHALVKLYGDSCFFGTKGKVYVLGVGEFFEKLLLDKVKESIAPRDK